MNAIRTDWVARMLGVLLAFHAMADLLRPEFIPVNPGSDVIAHEPSFWSSFIHLVVTLVVLPLSLWAGHFGRCDLTRSGWFALLTTGLLLFVAISLIQVDTIMPLIYFVLLAMVLLAALVFASTDLARDGGFQNMLAAAAIGYGLILFAAIVIGEYSFGRLASRAGPTNLGLVATMCLCCSAAIEHPRLRWGLIALSALTLFLTSARGAMVTSFAAALVMIVIAIARCEPRRRMGYYALFLCGVLTLPLLIPYVVEDLLRVDDPRRGLGSGLTGRSEAWGQALRLFAENPLTGVGYRTHETYITVATSAHEAYLAVLAELGPLALLIYLFLIVGAFVRELIRALRSGDRASIASAAFMCAFILIGFTENMALATGLPMPFAMMFITAFAWRRGLRATLADNAKASARRGPLMLTTSYSAEPAMQPDQSKGRSTA
ncbi:hypothetical protein B2G71_05195 [Novosphingobium sp. PC22D]|uniref:O-antigen ligase family protein n=1 Tax=Novosphingobium sp. PC22D TaxID=1962403 RepID=UPI000BFAC946|nr:O-antigen ligase family protein [Novosphingobium sp. PC22D]PEQ13717.1 hypothetical protein B2G71_05195 [Novosphingobium sp. PC22D]